MDNFLIDSTHMGGIIRNGSLTTRPPSPPYVHVPAVITTTDPANKIKPSYDMVEPGRLSTADIDTITGGRTQVTNNRHLTEEWRYEDRRKAQPVLDFLYLGPTSVVRDLVWLKQEGITMILVARDAQMVGMPSLSLNKAASELNVEVTFVDLATNQELIRNFPNSVNLINSHILRQNLAANQDPAMMKGKVLVVCETGNHRSAAIVAAYIMAMYNSDMAGAVKNMIGAVQFVSSQRFCTNFDEPTKHLLISYGNLLEAKNMTNQASLQENAVSGQQGNHPPTVAATKKRGIEDTHDEGDLDMDMARYEDRSTFAPYQELRRGSNGS